MKQSTHASEQPGWAVVTGASGGIGLELARCLAAYGHDLALIARSATALESLAAELSQAHGIRALAIATDLATQDGPEQLVRTLGQHGIVPRVLVNNAGIGLHGQHADNPVEDIEALLALNIRALTVLTRQLLPPMLEAGTGYILNVASVAGFLPGPLMAVYFASKAYVLSYSQALAQELASSSISVTALCPGPTRSAFFERAGMRGDALGAPADTRDVAEFGIRAMRRGQRVAIHGTRNRLMAFALRFVPRDMATRMAARVTRNR